MKTVKFASVLVLFFSFSLSVTAGGWLQGKKKGYFKLSQSFLRGDLFYDGQGNQTKITTTGVYITSLYGEYGISSKFDLVGYLPIVTRLTLNDVRFSDGRFIEGDEFTSVGDANVGLKYGIRQGKPFVTSVSLLLGLPIGSTSGGNTELLQTGDGEFNQMIKLEGGYSFSDALYANVGVAFNNRTRGFSEEFRYEAELGYTIKKKLLVALKLSAVESFMNGKEGGSTGNGVFSNNLEYLSFGPDLAYTFREKWGITAAYRTASSGQFIIAAPSFEIGLFLKVK